MRASVTHSQPQTSVRVILASQSPRRRELLTLVGIPHEVRPADIDESVTPGEEPIPHCERLARSKAALLSIAHPDAVVIGADTIVVIDGDILGKPRDVPEAEDMLRRLSGRIHTVHTAVAVARGGDVRSAVEQVQVSVRTLDDARISAYVATGEPMDKAGSYGIQGYGATIIERIDGDFFAVMGLPVSTLIDLLDEMGVHYHFGPLMA